jgi:hypothetical protein
MVTSYEYIVKTPTLFQKVIAYCTLSFSLLIVKVIEEGIK